MFCVIFETQRCIKTFVTIWQEVTCLNSEGSFFTLNVVWGYAVAQLVEALRYKPEGRGFDSRWYNWTFSLT